MSSRIILTLSCLVAASLAQGGGMAELKAITGDAPYSGTGNVPAPIPQPMGFWGRPRYSPMGFGASPYWGGYDGAYYGSDRFTSIGHSPYGGPGPIRSRPFNNPDDSLFTAMMSFLDGASSPFDSRPSPRRFNPTNPSFSSPSISQQPVIPHSPSSLPRPSTGSSFSLSSATGGGGGLGGFYKGNGN